MGRHGEAYKLDLKAPPVDGKANEECVRFFAELVGVPRSSVQIVQGAAGRMKLVEIEGVEIGEIERQLESALQRIEVTASCSQILRAKRLSISP